MGHLKARAIPLYHPLVEAVVVVVVLVSGGGGGVYNIFGRYRVPIHKTVQNCRCFQLG